MVTTTRILSFPSVQDRGNFRLDLGCGRYCKQGFYGIDMTPAPGVGLLLNLEYGLPFPDDSVAEISTSHFLQRLPDPKSLLADVHRACVDGAKVSIVVPLDDPSPGHLFRFDENWFHRELDASRFRLVKHRVCKKEGKNVQGKMHSSVQAELELRVLKAR